MPPKGWHAHGIMVSNFIVTLSLIRYYNLVILKKNHQLYDFAQLYHIYIMYMLDKIIHKTYEP
jgi:hypothetical protein